MGHLHRSQYSPAPINQGLMKTINLILGIHNHQPIGNFDHVFEDAYRKSYKPFLDLLERFPSVRLTLHYSGILLQWLKKSHPDALKQLRRLNRRGQIDFMGGPFYESILAIIPDADKSGQLRKMSDWLEEEFGHAPAGMWLPERVWEQHLAKVIAESGLHYVPVDDSHFMYAGLSPDELLGYHLTEEQGKTLALFPISKAMRYNIPFQPVQATIEYLRSLATEEGDRVIVYADDGEKFGVWPKTYEHVYQNRWLEEFFQALTSNADWIRIILFREAIEQLKPAGRVYLPNASYAEMMHWALPQSKFVLYEEFEEHLKSNGLMDRYGTFFKGGFWRNFLVKYYESNYMHKKMLRVSERVHRLAEKTKKGRSAATLEVARDHLWKAQCNDPYWHGVFGGIYLPVLRYPIYHHLISAERELDAVEKSAGIRTSVVDHDSDGLKEVLVENPEYNCYIKPDDGGTVFELDFKSISLNLLDVVSRREEGYHRKLAHAAGRGGSSVASIHDSLFSKEGGLERLLHYDSYRRHSFRDHFFGDRTTLEAVARSEFQEVGDFVAAPYEYRVSSRRSGRKQTHKVELWREGAVWQRETRHAVALRKSLTFRPESTAVEADYVLHNRSGAPITLWFGVEFNIGLQAGDAPDRYYFDARGKLPDSRLRSSGQIDRAEWIGLRDEWLGVDVRIECSQPAQLWRFPIETVSLSEAGFERIFQSSVVIPHWRFRLDREWSVKLVHRFARLK
jgi:hypothetical protein